MPDEESTTFGPNEWLVEEMYDQYKADPNSVSDSWREFFADYRTDDRANTNGNGTTPVSPAPPAATPTPTVRDVPGSKPPTSSRPRSS